MSPVKIPDPTRSTSEQIGRLDRALKLFADSRTRREETQRAVAAARFKLGDLKRNEPRTFTDIRAQAAHEKALRDAQAASDEATTVFLQIDGEVAQAATSVWEAHSATCASVRTELEPVRRAAIKQLEAAVDTLLAATDAACALNRVIGNGAPQVYPQVMCPLTGTDLAYNRPRAAPAVAPDWLKYQQLRSAAMDVDRELPPAQAAE